MRQVEGRELARVIDANLNRVAEGLRVIEEVCRFIRDDARTSEALKLLRHQCRDLGRTFPGGEGVLLLARDAREDVGAGTVESGHGDLDDLVAANWKRVQEGLRVLEEFSRMVDQALTTGFKALRFRTYALEKESQLRVTD